MQFVFDTKFRIYETKAQKAVQNIKEYGIKFPSISEFSGVARKIYEDNFAQLIKTEPDGKVLNDAAIDDSSEEEFDE